MTVDFAYDPVMAMDEATATGETAVLFSEIRQTMRIPLVISIWRGLAGMGDSLRLAWAAAKPIYGKRRARARADAQCCCGRPASSGTVGAYRTCLHGTHRRPMDRFASMENDSLRAPGRSARYSVPSAIAWAVIGTGWCAPPSSTRESIAWS